MGDIELLAPGGDYNSVKAGILAGADAVFLGLSEYSARKRAKNVSLDELKELVLIAHEHDVKLYITMNTLFLQNEFEDVISLVKKIFILGIDALIIQDYGMLGVVKDIFPSLEIHASTQMTTHNSKQVELLSHMGVMQVNYSRELSIDEIKHLNIKTHELGMKSEIFVHGAYCVSYSGQCYLCSSLYGLSGNKGSCVQPCRREFVNDKKIPSLPFNLKDNSAFTSVDKIIEAGADSIKIEGRIKGPEYVYTVIDTWRKQLDKYKSEGVISQSNKVLKSVFNRSFSDGYLHNNISINWEMIFYNFI